MPMPPAVRYYYVPYEEADDGGHDLEEEEPYCPLPLSPPYSPAQLSSPPASPTVLPTSPPSDDHADHTTDSLITFASTVDVAADDDFYFDFDFDDDADDDDAAMDEKHAEYLAECVLKHYNGDAANEAKYELVAATASASSFMDCRGAFHIHC
uniref:Uncharacterized protein n=1 Tax=Oryza meridionalis TaxID=40149 RepID=A0A0E0C376_9ORYZ